MQALEPHWFELKDALLDNECYYHHHLAKSFVVKGEAMPLSRRVILVAISAIVTVSTSLPTPAAIAENLVRSDGQEVVNDLHNEVYTTKSITGGVVSPVDNGTSGVMSDGSVSIASVNGSELNLESALSESDDSFKNNSYNVDQLAEGERVPVATRSVAGCAFGTIITIGAIASIPATIGLDALPAIAVAGGTAGMTSYECATIGK